MNKLQFVRCNTLFTTREDAIQYIQLNRVSVEGEPIIAKYGSSTEPNIIFGIGSVIGKYFIIDAGKITSDIADIITNLDNLETTVNDNNTTLTNALNAVQTLVNNVITSGGLDTDGTYVVALGDSILKDATNAHQADLLLSKAIQDLIASINNGSLETTSKLSQKADNIIYKEIDNGIYASVDLDYDGTSGNLILKRANFSDKTIAIPLDTFFVRGYFDSDTQEIVLVMKDSTSVESEVRIPASALVDAWSPAINTSATIDQETSAILLKKEKDTNPSSPTNGEDLLYADIKIDDAFAHNILFKNSNGYLHVSGNAANLFYDTTDLSLKQKIDDIVTSIASSLTEAKAYSDSKLTEAKTYADTQDTAKLAEAKTYSDNKLVEAKEYTDTKIGDANFYTDSKLTEAKEYADAQDVTNLTAAKTYTDTENVKNLNSAKAYADSKDADTLTSANTYTDGKVSTTLSDSKTYTDGKLYDFKTYVDEQDTAKLAEAKAYADTQDATKLAEAKVYSDNKLVESKSYTDTKTTETKTYTDNKLVEAKAYSDAQDGVTLNSANAYADSKDTTTLASANTYTDGKVSTTLIDAKAYSDIQDAHILTQAKAYSDTQDAAKLTEAKTYSDTNLTAARNYSDTQDAHILTQAKAYSDTQDATNLTTAKLYTDGKVGDEATTRKTADDALKASIDAINAKSTVYVDTPTINNTTSVSGNTTTITNDVKLSNDGGNIVQALTDGLYASVDLTYDTALGRLTLTTSNGHTKDIDIAINGLVEDAYYDSPTRSIIIEFKLTNGTTQTVTIDLASLVQEWDVDNTVLDVHGLPTAVILTKAHHAGGEQDKLSAEILMSEATDNILRKQANGALYVKGTADNITYAQPTTHVYITHSNVQDALTDLDKALVTANNRIDNLDVGDIQTDLTNLGNRITIVEGKTTTNETNITNLTTRVTDNETNITNLTTTVNDLDTKVTQLDTDLTDLETRVTTNETNIGTNTSDISGLKTRVDSVDTKITTLEGNVVNSGTVSGNTLTLTKANGSTVPIDVTSLALNTFVTSVTISGAIVTLNRNNGQAALTLDLSGLPINGGTF